MKSLLERHGWASLIAWSLVTVLIYLPGLHGPALLDDVPNIGPIIQWAQDDAAENPLLAERKAGPLGRPISLASFMANAVTTGDQLWPMKLTNVIFHVLTGLMLFGFLKALLRRCEPLEPHARLVAWCIAAAWLVLPQHVVTVLYTVQRMTILAALFTITALWAYASARNRMEDGRPGVTWRLCALLVFSALAVLSKESALVLPALLLVVEWGFYSPRPGQKRPALARAIMLVFGILPIIFATLWLAFNFDYLLGGYASRDFTLYERALTQSRILWEYAYSTFMPLGHTANVYNDDYRISLDLFDPPITALALSGWAALAIMLWMIRRHRIIVAGILFFAAAHLLESTIFALEIYFVHRNYLPSVGLVMALVAALFVFWPVVVARAPKLRGWAIVLVAAPLVANAMSTASRAHLWGSPDRLHAHAQRHNPASLRLQTDLLRIALEVGNIDLARQRLNAASRAAPASEQGTVVLWEIFSHCHLEHPIPTALVDDFTRKARGRITNYANIAMLQLRSSVVAGHCGDLDKAQVASVISKWADDSLQPSSDRNVWEARAVAATLFLAGDELALAETQIDKAFAGSGRRFELGVFAFEIAALAGNKSKAKEILKQLEGGSVHILRPDQVQTLKQLNEFIEQGGFARETELVSDEIKP